MCPPSKRKELWGFRGSPPTVKEAFNVLDKDGDGRIAFNDLQDFFHTHKQTYLSRGEIQSMISVVDKDHNGYVEFEQFEGLMMALMTGEGKNEENNALEEAFRVMDRDGDGIVSVRDLKSFMGEAMHSVNDEDVVEMIEAAGACAQSGICYKEFLALMMAMMNGSQ
ncbi:hypothetical protein SUGI_0634690 [Cryptomeria japonica]|uniref:uncharacterized protein LOC131051086 n=1 Tax=Cryptomeria japonica TaxID=3369 RepID=UPI002414C24E|nr:uncharacterized protein LOC131051086 [Cryptomeria japonica]GLJ31616.1 hypothetical protein SUGI_0634690 [Cryptomeria japonica]